MKSVSSVGARCARAHGIAGLYPGALAAAARQRVPRRAHLDGSSRRDRRRQDDRHHSDGRHRAERTAHGARQTQFPGEAQSRRNREAASATRSSPRWWRTCPRATSIPPTGHMRYAGTITTPQDVFVKVLEYAARSFKQHGFVDVVLVGDSGGNQEGQRLVAAALNKEWAATPARVHHITAYYPGRGDDWVVSQGVSAADVGSHAGTHDTASLMYINPSMLRFDKIGPGKTRGRPGARRQPRESHGALRQAHSRDANRGRDGADSRTARQQPAARRRSGPPC